MVSCLMSPHNRYLDLGLLKVILEASFDLVIQELTFMLETDHRSAKAVYCLNCAWVMAKAVKNDVLIVFLYLFSFKYH